MRIPGAPYQNKMMNFNISTFRKLSFLILYSDVYDFSSTIRGKGIVCIFLKIYNRVQIWSLERWGGNFQGQLKKRDRLFCDVQLFLTVRGSVFKLFKTSFESMGMYGLTDTGEDSKFVHRRKRPKVDASIFLLFFRRVRATSMTQHRVENTRVHFWTFSPV